MKKTRKVLALLLVFAMLLSVGALAADLRGQDVGTVSNTNAILPINTNYPYTFSKERTQKFNKELDANSIKRSCELIFASLTQAEDGTFSASGIITLLNNSNRFYISGQLLEVTLSNGHVGRIGTLSGYTNGSQRIHLSIHQDTSTGDLFVNAALGVHSQTSDAVETAFFGSEFAATSELVKAYLDTTISEENTPNDLLSIDRSSSYGDMVYRSYSYDTQATGGSTLTVMGISLYSQTQVTAQTNSKIAAKVTANFDNFETYIRNRYYVTSAQSVLVYGDECEIEMTASNDVELSSETPNEYSIAVSGQNRSLTLPIPYYIAGNLGVFSLTVPAGTGSISSYCTNRNGSTTPNYVHWDIDVTYARTALHYGGGNDNRTAQNGYLGSATYSDLVNGPATRSLSTEAALTLGYAVYDDLATSYIGTMSYSCDASTTISTQ